MGGSDRLHPLHLRGDLFDSSADLYSGRLRLRSKSPAARPGDGLQGVEDGIEESMNLRITLLWINALLSIVFGISFIVTTSLLSRLVTEAPQVPQVR